MTPAIGATVILALVVRIVADTRERHSGIPTLLAELDGVAVALQRLLTGDYQLGHGAVVERKAVRNLHLTVINGRFWRPIRELRRAHWPYLVIEGMNIEAGPLSPSAARGVCIAAADLGIFVVRSVGPRDTVQWPEVDRGGRG